TMLIGMSLETVSFAADGSCPAVAGELRLLAVPATSAEVIARLHHEGWLEARGQLLSTIEFPDLFDAIGRTWTSDIVPGGRFAVPDVRYPPAPRSSDNPFGVLGPGDLLTGGRVEKRRAKPASLSYWIFVGRDLAGTHPVEARR